MNIAKTVMYIAIATFFSAAFALTVSLTRLVESAKLFIDRSPTLITAELDSTRHDLNFQLTGLRSDLTTQVSSIRTDLFSTVNSQISGIRSDLFSPANGQITALRGVVDKQLTSSLSKIDASISLISSLKSSLDPTVKNINEISKQVADASPLFLDCEFNPDCAFNRFQGTSKAIETSARDLSLMANEIQSTMPKVLADVRQGTEAGMKASQATQQLMSNLAKETKPLPAWLRIPLSITGAVAPTVAGGVGALAATGYWNK